MLSLHPHHLKPVRRWLSGLVCLLGLWLWGCSAATIEPSTEVARVSRVVDGQTIEVLRGQSVQAETVRLLGIQVPKGRQTPQGKAAQTWLNDQLMGRLIDLEQDIETHDEHGDGLAYVWLDKELVNELLVQEGLVLAVERSPNWRYSQRLAHAQETARLLGRGIWNPERPLHVETKPRSNPDSDSEMCNSSTSTSG